MDRIPLPFIIVNTHKETVRYRGIHPQPLTLTLAPTLTLTLTLALAPTPPSA